MKLNRSYQEGEITTILAIIAVVSLVVGVFTAKTIQQNSQDLRSNAKSNSSCVEVSNVSVDRAIFAGQDFYCSMKINPGGSPFVICALGSTNQPADVCHGYTTPSGKKYGFLGWYDDNGNPSPNGTNAKFLCNTNGARSSNYQEDPGFLPDLTTRIPRDQIQLLGYDYRFPDASHPGYPSCGSSSGRSITVSVGDYTPPIPTLSTPTTAPGLPTNTPKPGTPTVSIPSPTNLPPTSTPIPTPTLDPITCIGSTKQPCDNSILKEIENVSDSCKSKIIDRLKLASCNCQFGGTKQCTFVPSDPASSPPSCASITPPSLAQIISTLCEGEALPSGILTAPTPTSAAQKAGICDPAPEGNACAPSNMSIFGADANKASVICKLESGGNAAIISHLSCLDKEKNANEYSIGLFQLNCITGDNCPNAFSDHSSYIDQVTGKTIYTCTPNPTPILGETWLNHAVKEYSDPTINIGFAYDKFTNNGSKWSSLWKKASQMCNLDSN